MDIAQPLIERLAEASGELARLSVVDGDRLPGSPRPKATARAFATTPTWAWTRGSPAPSSGHAWLHDADATSEAVELVSRQGFGPPKDYGPKAPTTVKALLGFLHAARVRGYAMIDEVFAPGMTAVAAPVQRGEPAGASA